MKHKFLALLATLLAIIVPFANFGTAAAASAALSPMNGTLSISLGTTVTEYTIYQCHILSENPNSSPLSASFTFRADSGYGNFSGKYYRLNADGRVDDGGSTNVVATKVNSVLPAGVVEWQLPLNDLEANTAMGIVFASNARGTFSDGNTETQVYDGGIRVDNTSPNNADFNVTFTQELGSPASPLTGAYYALNSSNEIAGVATTVTAQLDNNPVAGGGANWVLQMTQMGGQTALVINLCGSGANVQAAAPAAGNSGATCSYALGTYTANVVVNERTGPGSNYGLFGQVQIGAEITIVGFDTSGCWGHSSGGYWVSMNLFTPGSHPAPTGNACQFVAGTNADGQYTFNAGVTYNAPLMIAVPKLSDGRNQFSARQVVRGSWTTPNGGGHVWMYTDPNCDINAELAHVPTTP